MLLDWKSLYNLEIQTNEPIGCKERFIVLSKLSKQLFESLNSLNILDGGGSSVTSRILKIIFPDSYIISVNINGNENNVADVSIVADIANFEKILKASGVSGFDVIFLGEVFEHLFQPYPTIKNLITLLNPGGYLIITTPNLANIYNRILLMFGKSLYNYRPLGILPGDDHITLVTQKQMINLLHNHLHLELCQVQGYSYYERKIGIVPESPYARSGIKLRFIRGIINKVVPLSFKEGLLYIARKISTE